MTFGFKMLYVVVSRAVDVCAIRTYIDVNVRVSLLLLLLLLLLLALIVLMV